MSNLFSIKKTIALIVCIQLSASAVMAQVKYHVRDNVQSVVSGTSTLHDWNMKASRGECDATFVFNAANQLTGLTLLNFSMPVEGLKSEHGSMDKNAYKALKVNQYPSITYRLTSATVDPNGAIRCMGKLTIAGTTVDAELLASAKVINDKSIAVTGSKKISMKDFKIDPPSFMLGTVKTGNDITLKFDLTLVKQ